MAEHERSQALDPDARLWLRSATVTFRPLACLVLVLFCVCIPTQGRADVDPAKRSAARALGKEAIALYKAGNYEEALDRFSRAHQLVGLTTTGLWRGRCLGKVGRLIEASEQYLDVTRMKLDEDARDVHEAAQVDAKKELALLEPRIPHLTIRIEGELPGDTTISLDGNVVPKALLGVHQPIDPGEHTVLVEGGGTKETKKFEIAEGGSLEIPLRLIDRGTSIGDEREAPKDFDTDPGATQRALGWVTMGLGGAGLVVGAVTGGLALSNKSALESNCPNAQCTPPFHADVDSFETLRLASTATLIAGGVLFAAGLTVVVSAPERLAAPDAAVTLRVSPQGVLVGGTF